MLLYSKSAVRAAGGFTLTELVLAIGLFAFALLALIGLFSVGMRQAHNAANDVQAANLVSHLIAQSRVDPLHTNAAAVLPPVLPPLDVVREFDPAAPIYLTSTGEPVAREEADFRVDFSVRPDESGRGSRLFISVGWPALAGHNQTQGNYQVFTYVATK